MGVPNNDKAGCQACRARTVALCNIAKIYRVSDVSFCIPYQGSLIGSLPEKACVTEKTRVKRTCGLFQTDPTD